MVAAKERAEWISDMHSMQLEQASQMHPRVNRMMMMMLLLLLMLVELVVWFQWVLRAHVHEL
jgi:hypothetical protein